MPKLTPAQTQVRALIVRGLQNKQIAYELRVTEATVKAHVSAVLTAYRVASSRALAAARIRELEDEVALLRQQVIDLLDHKSRS